MSFDLERSHPLTPSKMTVWQALPSTFSTALSGRFGHSDSEVLLSAIIFLGKNRISGLASKASRHLGILHCSKSFLGTPELLSTSKTFICYLMDFCSPLWARTPASHFAQLDAVEIKPRPSRLVESLMMKLSVRADQFPITDRSVVTVVHCLLPDLAPSVLSVL